MQNLIKYALNALCLLLSVFAVAQTTQKWSLTDCVNYAYENNLQLQRNKMQVTMSENNLQQAKNDRLPSVSGSTSWNSNYGRNIDFNTNGYTQRHSSNINYGVGTSVNLFSGFRKRNQIKKNELDLQTQLLNIEAIKENLALNITSLYLNILYAQEQLQVTKENLAIAKKQQNRIQKLVDAGKMPKGDLLQQQSQVAKNESNIVEAENRLSLAYLDLYQLLDIPNEKAFLIETPAVDNIEAAAGALLNYTARYGDIIAQRPEIKAFDYKIKSAEESIRIAKSSYYPSLNLNANIGSGYSNQRFDYKIDPTNPKNFIKNGVKSFSDQYEENLSKSWGLSLNIPIFSKFQTRTNVRNATLQLEDIKVQQQQEHNRLYKELQQAYTNALAAVKKYEAQRKAVSALEETFRYSEEKYQLGMLSNFDYNEALNNVTVARSQMLQAKYEYLFRTKILEYYNGLPLQF